MSSHTWPATWKQRNYGRALEEQLGEPESAWHEMTVVDASRRIRELVTLRDFRRIVSTL